MACSTDASVLLVGSSGRAGECWIQQTVGLINIRRAEKAVICGKVYAEFQVKERCKQIKL